MFEIIKWIFLSDIKPIGNKKLKKLSKSLKLNSQSFNFKIKNIILNFNKLKTLNHFLKNDLLI